MMLLGRRSEGKRTSDRSLLRSICQQQDFRFLLLLHLLVRPKMSSKAGEIDSFYIVTAPAVIRPNSHYHVNLQLVSASKQVTFDVELSGKAVSGGTDYSLKQSTAVKPTSATTTLDFEIGQWTPGDYQLKVWGKSADFTFIKKKKLRFEPKCFSFFIQTDKGMYKPGEVVKFRILVVNSDLLPNVRGELDVYLKDPKGNLIKQWKGVSLSNGIFTNELQLLEQPALGDWSIHLELQGVKQSKKFRVAEYVLPVFGVDISLLPKYVTYAKPEVVAKIKAAYTYGKPVKGDASLSCKLKQGYTSLTFHKKDKLGDDGIAEIRVNIVKDLMKDLQSKVTTFDVIFSVDVEETLTGRKCSASTEIKLFPDEIKIQLLKLAKTFKPGLKYSAYLKVAYQDDTPVEDGGPVVSLNYGFDCDGEFEDVLELTPIKGLALIELRPPKGTTFIGWEAEYRGYRFKLSSIKSAKSASDSFIQLISMSQQNNLEDLFGGKAALVGQEMIYQINSTEPLKEMSFTIMAKGNIVKTDLVRIDPASTTKEFSIKITPEMAPAARLIVYYIRGENREVVADSVTFQVAYAIKTSVKLASNVAEDIQPGTRVNIQVRTSPSAYVGLLGVDQSVLLLKSGNDITRADVIQELESYDPGYKSRKVNTSAAAIFDHSGLIVLTNARLFRKDRSRQRPTWRNERSSPESDPEESRPQRMSNEAPVALISPPAYVNYAAREGISDYERLRRMYSIKSVSCYLVRPRAAHSHPKARTPAPPMKLREKFPETWIWTDVLAGSDGIAKYSDEIPDSITSWFISAFALDANTGLGLADESLKINVFRPFFIQLSLPYSLIRGESVELKILVFNYQNKEVQAEVVMENSKNEFEFKDEQAGDKEVRKVLTIPKLDGVTLSQMITPKQLGPIDIRVRAVCENAADAILKKLLVKAEGQTVYLNNAHLIKREADSEPFQKEFTIQVPEAAVPGSVRMSVSCVPDILGSTMNNLEDLLRMPCGCGEQNMINFVPNIVVLNYLTKTNRLTPEIKAKAIRHIESGYQGELAYRRSDGSFSCFSSDERGSTWLTAFVMKSFIQARPYVHVDADVIHRGLSFLMRQQEPDDGRFEEHGEVHQKDLQGGAVIQSSRSSVKSDDSAKPKKKKSDDDDEIQVLFTVRGKETSSGLGDNVESEISSQKQKHESALESHEAQIDSDPKPEQAKGGKSHPKKPNTEALQKELQKKLRKEQRESAAGALTAYVLIAALEHLSPNSKAGENAESLMNASAIKEAEGFIHSRLVKTSKPYEVAIITYALQLADSQHKDEAVRKLMSLAVHDESGFMYWNGKQTKPSTKVAKGSKRPRRGFLDHWDQERNLSLDIETTSYALLTLVARGDVDNSIFILQWLVSKQNSRGGFSSTQDTVIGLQALGAIAEQLTTNKLDMNVIVSHGNAQDADGRQEMMRLNAENALVLQQIELQPATEWIDIEAQGTGMAIVQVSYQYNIVRPIKDVFTLDLLKDASDDKLSLDIYIRYKEDDTTNMAVMEVELPSGYVADLERLHTYIRPDVVKRIDTANADGTVIIYLDRVTSVMQLITVPAYRAHKVDNLKPVPLTLYDYYDKQHLSRIFYLPTSSTSEQVKLQLNKVSGSNDCCKGCAV